MTTITPLAIPEVLLITPKRHGDARGWFAETWSTKALAGTAADTAFVQDNQAFSAAKGTLRGLHFQKGALSQGKLIRALRGAIFDVAVDLRAGSATYGQWVSADLTADSGEQLWPRGFAHATALTADCEIFTRSTALRADAEVACLERSDLAIPGPWTGNRCCRARTRPSALRDPGRFLAPFRADEVVGIKAPPASNAPASSSHASHTARALPPATESSSNRSASAASAGSPLPMA
jgi:dTDP-4-dehydrorhamnose 3,5-epimerase